MKKSVLALTAALSFGVSAAQTAAPASAPQVPTMTDVPAGHWAKDAIDRLVSKGILLGYPDGTFRGTQNLTRYEAAVIIARLLDQIRTGQTSAGDLSPEDAAALQAAIQDLSADLAALGVRVSDLEENAVSKDDFSRLEARVEELSAGRSGGSTSASGDIQAQIDDLAARIDGYDALRADVDDNASSIAALNDLTVLLNEDILALQDRVSGLEAAQADFVQRSDFMTLETSVKDINNRVVNLERNAFIIKPSLTIGYAVSRTNRNFDVDRIFPMNADGSIASNAFTANESSSDDARGRMDFSDFGGSADPIVSGPEGLYGFASGPTSYTVYLMDSSTPPDPAKAKTVMIDAKDKLGYTAPEGYKVDTSKGNAGYDAGKSFSRYKEGETSISVGLVFNTNGAFKEVTSDSGGSMFTTAGKLTVNKVDFDFGIVSSLPTGLDKDGKYPVLIDKDTDNVYRPLFLRFKNATLEFSVGNNPVIVTLGKKMKFIYGDYLGDNNKTGRGDGFKVEIDGSNLPGIGALKPKISTIYGSRNGKDTAPSEPGYGMYYRGARAEITPVGTLTAGGHVLQEVRDSFGAANPTASDVTAIGADLHGKAAGVELHSEFVTSRAKPVGGSSFSTNAFYARMATRKDDRSFDLDTPGAKFGSDAFNVAIYDLNYRQIGKGMTGGNTISEADYDRSGLSGTSKLNLAYGANDGKTSAPFANLKFTNTKAGPNDPSTGAFVGQRGFGVKAAASLGFLKVGGYYDDSSSADGKYEKMTEMGADAMLGVSIFTVRGSYATNNSNRYTTPGTTNAQDKNARRIAVQADAKLGMGLMVGGYYRDVATGAQGSALVRSTSDGGALKRGYLASHFEPGKDNYLSGLQCEGSSFGTSVNDSDGVGNVLDPSAKPEASRSKTCFSSFGVELGHDGADTGALVKDLWFRVGFGRVYNDASKAYDSNMVYGDARYDHKFGAVSTRLAGSFSNASAKLDSREAGNRSAFGLIVRTDPLDGVPFKPQLNGQVGYYSSQNKAGGGADYTATGLKYGAGIVLNEFLMPNTRVGVRYDGYRGVNRSYTPFSGGDKGFFKDENHGRTTNLNGVYFEGAYYDMVFSYGRYSLSQKDKAGTEFGSGLNDNKPAYGQTFKISYKVNF